MPKLSRYVIGIDLGTTNSALAYVDRRSGRGATVIRTFEVPQLVAPGEVRARPLLPSCVYIPGEHELPASATALPFGERQGFVVGEFARLQGGRVPGRLVASSKSWLCYGRVDRRAPILPWDAPPDVPRISPIEAAARLLAHFRDAWDSLIGQGEPEKAFLAQEVIVTVPASFDAVARQLTLEAAREAGIEHALLIEEPQAALYAFIAASGGRLEERLPAGSVVLVIDVGGGTTDLTLVSVRAATPDDAEERLVFERTAVSDHLLLGGDNMDLALARYLAPRLEGGDGEPELGPSEWGMLRHACREAKESLLAEQAPERTRITLPGSGTRLVGGARSAELTRADVLTLVLEGFFPKVDLEDTTPRRSRAGLHELGLPFVADPAVTRHLGAFLRQHAPRGPEGAGGGAPVARPTAVLFNGAVMTNRLVRERVVDTIEGWTGLRPIELPAESFDLAVARGAAYFGLVRRDRGLRIRAGLGRSYYVGVDVGKAAPAALCLTPRRLEPEKPVAVGLGARLQTNLPVQFPFYFSSVRDDAPGALIGEPRLATEETDGEFQELPPLVTVLRAGKRRSSERKEVPVELVARLTEVGTLELQCRATDGTGRAWRLELTVRPSPRIEAARPREAEEAVAAEKLARARELVASAFAAAPGPEGPLARLGRELEEVFGADREAWPVAICRKLFEIVFEVREARTRSPEHEARFWNLAAFSLRPGFGAVFDDHRVAKLWRLALSGLTFGKSDACRLEFLIFQRRISGGLARGQQEQIYQGIREDLFGRSKRHIPRQEAAEQWRLAASLEHLPSRRKEELGSRLLSLMEAGEGPPRWGIWAIGRFGTRLPQYGPVNEVVRREVAASWLDRALALIARGGAAAGEDRERTVFSIVQMARLTGDPARDLSPALRARAADALRAIGAPESALRPLAELVEAAPLEERLLFGDSIPTGLKLS